MRNIFIVLLLMICANSTFFCSLLGGKAGSPISGSNIVKLRINVEKRDTTEDTPNIVLKFTNISNDSIRFNKSDCLFFQEAGLNIRVRNKRGEMLYPVAVPRENCKGKNFITLRKGIMVTMKIHLKYIQRIYSIEHGKFELQIGYHNELIDKKSSTPTFTGDVESNHIDFSVSSKD